jgi:two-component system, LytTR family, response regulator
MMDPIKAILIDDESSSLENLQRKIDEFCPEIKVVAISEQPGEAIFLIRHHRPEVIFLDIEMPHMNGFRMLDELGDYQGEIIFTTAYSHYAIEAIRLSAFDYLMKPVIIQELQTSVSRLARQLACRTQERLDLLRQSLSRSQSQEDRMAVPTGDGLEFIQIKDVIRIESSSNYSRIFFVNSRSIRVTRQLKEFEEMLLTYRFCRVHNVHLINLNHVRKYIRGEGGRAIMINGDEIDISRRRRDDFLKLMNPIG